MEEIIKILEEIKKEELDPKEKNTIHVNNSIYPKLQRLNSELAKVKDYEIAGKIRKQLIDLNNENSLINILHKQKGTLTSQHATSLIAQMENLITKTKEEIEEKNKEINDIYETNTLEQESLEQEINESIEVEEEKKEEYIMDNEKEIPNLEINTNSSEKEMFLQRRAVLEAQNRENTRKLRQDIITRETLKDNAKFLSKILDKNGNRVYSDEDLENMSYYEMEALATDIQEHMNKDNYYKIINELNDERYRNFLSVIMDKDGNRVYSDEQINGMNSDDLSEEWLKATDGMREEEIENIKNRAKREAIKKEKGNKTDEPYSDNIDEVIEKLKESLDENMTDEQINNIVDKIEESVLLKFKKQQEQFENDLKQTINLDDKLVLIEKREEEIAKYKEIFKHDNEKINNVLEAKYNEVEPKLKSLYENAKSNGEYTWKNFDEINESKKYINDNITKDESLKQQFEILREKMTAAVMDTTGKTYEEWKKSMQEFVNNAGLDSTKIVPFLTADLKVKFPAKDLSVDKDFNIVGLNKEKEKNVPTQDDEIKKPKRGRLKVVAKKALKWMKEHKLVTIALGLALVTALLFAIPTTHMMINSALWHLGNTLGWSSNTLGGLNSINQGIAKSVKGGQYIYESISGAYTLGGAVGAETLYSAGAANLIGALTGLAGLGTIGTLGASIINKIKNRKNKKPENVEITEDLFDDKGNVKEEYRIIKPEKEKELEKEEDKTTPLTREQIAELIKAEVEKVTADKDKEIEALKAEIERLKALGIEPEELEEENKIRR